MPEPASRFAQPSLLFWDDLRDGDAFETGARTVTEADIVSFCALSGDWNQLHCDAEFAATTSHGQRIAPGLLVLSIMSGLITRTIFNQRIQHALIGMAGFECRMRAPCFIGDTLHATVSVGGLRESRQRDRGIATFRREVFDHAGRLLLDADFTFLIRRNVAA